MDRALTYGKICFPGSQMGPEEEEILPGLLLMVI